MKPEVLIIDFGSQYTQLIARRVRELGVYAEILEAGEEVPFSPENPPKGVILSGGPDSVHSSTLALGPELFQAPCPFLGICFGMQLMNALHGGRVERSGSGEYGRQRLSFSNGHPLFKGLPEKQDVWMSHGDSVSSLAEGFYPIALSADGRIAAMAHRSLPRYGLQFHPEVSHTERGDLILKNFLDLAGCSYSWSMDSFIEREKEAIREQVGEGGVVSLVSGGVDSTAATLLCCEALGPERVYPLHIDSGLMREGESRQVLELLNCRGMPHVAFTDASKRFLEALRGVVEPEEKRRRIGSLFIEILQEEMKRLEADRRAAHFCQGTLYTDLIESGKGCGAKASVIKSHHNVNIALIEEKKRLGLVVEPNRAIFKDEVRKVCRLLGVPEKLIGRHPFPGPGLAIRILGEVTEERLRALRRADEIYLEELDKEGLYDRIWQAFAIYLPVETVGVMGDKRSVGHVIALRAVESQDGMTAEAFPLPHPLLSRISTRIINEVEAVNRVVYDTTSKPPGTIEWE